MGLMVWDDVSNVWADAWASSDSFASGETTFPRLLANGTAGPASGVMRLTYFTAQRTESITSLRVAPATLAGATPTIARIGVFWVDTTAARTTSADGVTNATTTITSATAAFTSADVNRAVTGTDIPAGTYIASVTNATTAVLSAAATGSHTGIAFTIGGIDNITLIGSTANDTALFSDTTTHAAKALQATWSKVRGQRYAYGILVVTAATAPTFAAITPAGMTVELPLAPRMSGMVASLSDLPTGVTANGSVTASGQYHYVVAVP